MEAMELPDDLLTFASEQAFAKGIRLLQGARFAPTDEGHVRVLLDHMAPPECAMILDVGCGFGEVAKIVGKIRRDLKFILLNKNWSQLSRAPDLSGRVQADAHGIPLTKHAVDGVIFCYSLCHMNFTTALSEAYRITKPGGFMFVFDYDRLRGDDNLFMRRLFARALPFAIMREVAECHGWQFHSYASPDSDDTLFREAFGNDAEYDLIFNDIRPAMWKMIKP
jgi:ubiquinone/menaquinone biosynthesis C-methylase UbiE